MSRDWNSETHIQTVKGRLRMVPSALSQETYTALKKKYFNNIKNSTLYK